MKNKKSNKKKLKRLRNKRNCLIKSDYLRLKRKSRWT